LKGEVGTIGMIKRVMMNPLFFKGGRAFGFFSFLLCLRVRRTTGESRGFSVRAGA